MLGYAGQYTDTEQLWCRGRRLPVRLLTTKATACFLGAAVVGSGCWGDDVPSLDRVGAVRTGSGEVSVLFAGCPGESVERVQLNLTDDDFEVEGVLWEVEADNGVPQSSFTVGAVPSGSRTVTALERSLQPGDHVQAVVTSSEFGTIRMSFIIGGLRSDEVLVRQDRYRSREDFGDQADESCREG